jgi:hypothetical protein
MVKSTSSISREYIPDEAAGVRSAHPAVIRRIREGDRLELVYDDGVAPGEFILQVASLVVSDVSEHAVQVADPQHLINKGDSGGAVYFNGMLVGADWSIGEYGGGQGVNISLLEGE